MVVITYPCWDVYDIVTVCFRFDIDQSMTAITRVNVLNHLPLVLHICVREWVSICSDNGMSPNRHQAIISTNAWVLSIGPLGKHFSEILIKIQRFSFMKMHLKMSEKWWPFVKGVMSQTRQYASLTYWKAAFAKYFRFVSVFVSRY